LKKLRKRKNDARKNRNSALLLKISQKSSQKHLEKRQNNNHTSSGHSLQKKTFTLILLSALRRLVLSLQVCFIINPARANRRSAICNNNDSDRRKKLNNSTLHSTQNIEGINAVTRICAQNLFRKW
jgi:hypothetical protein